MQWLDMQQAGCLEDGVEDGVEDGEEGGVGGVGPAGAWGTDGDHGGLGVPTHGAQCAVGVHKSIVLFFAPLFFHRFHWLFSVLPCIELGSHRV